MNPDQMPVDNGDEDGYQYRDFENVDNGLIKNEINMLIWVHGNPDWTLEEAERVAIKIYDILVGEK